MANPNRPQYQDIIASTWGQAVADTVIRRYATAAARDADLSGFTPAQLTGQVVAVGTAFPLLTVCIGGTTAPIWVALPLAIGGRMYPTVQTVLGNGVLGQVLQMATEYLVGGVTLAGNALVIPFGGVYLVTASCQWQSANNPVGAGDFQTCIAVNGSTARIFGPYHQTGTSFGPCSGSAMMPLNQNDAVSLYGYQATGAAAGTNPQSSMTWLDLHYVGPRANPT